MTWAKAVLEPSPRGKLRGMTYFWVSDQGDKYHGWEGSWALAARQSSADSQQGYVRRDVTRYDSEDAARGRGAGLAGLSEQVRKDLDDPNWPARHDLPADD
jgi:hypothetical protein